MTRDPRDDDAATDRAVEAMHTPGPWLVRVDRPTGIGRTSAVYVCSAQGWPEGQLARVNVQDGIDERVANARLIAAAPDLLAAHLAWEAAEDARNDCTDYEDGCDNEGPWEQCPLCSERFGDAIDLRRAAIAKATGK